jgi:hypothetical protein
MNPRITLTASRLRVFFSLSIFAVLVSVQLLAQSPRASVAGHRTRASKATAGLSNHSPASGLSFAAAVPYYSGGNGANAAAIADINGDGFPDLVVTNWCTDSTCTGGAVGVLLGKGDGTFQTAVAYPSGGLFANSVAIADVNGDGKLDLVVANCGSNSPSNCVSTSSSGNVAVLLGNGDGTFQTAVPYSLGANGATSVAVADVNGDGKLDVIVATGSNTAGLVGVLLGNGDGTFQAEVTYGSGGLSPLALAVADVNGDGHPDVVIANQCIDSTCTSSNVGVLLNTGTGTFGTAATVGSGGLFPDWVVITDVDGDSKPDLVVANSSSSTTVDDGNVGVLLGKGDGTFQTAVAYPSGGFGAASVAVADVNGDSKPDLVVVNCSATSSSCVGGGGTVGVLLGNGNGTFQTAVTLGSGGNTPFGVTVADLNGDSKPDIVAANCVSNTCGAANGAVGVLINASTGGSATALTSSLNPSTSGQPVTFTATVTSLAFKQAPTGKVSFAYGSTQLGTSNLNTSGVATLTTSTLAVGTDSVTATYSGDANFTTSTSPAVQQVVQNVSTTNLTVSPGTAAFGTSVTLTATVSSPSGTPPDGETVTFKDATGTLATGKLSKGTATFISTTIPAGTYSVVASYPGDADFLPSTSTAQTLDVQSFTLTANPTTITVPSPGQSGSTTITIATLGNLKATSVTGFACSGLPSGSACTFGAVGSNDTVSLNITTTGASALRSPLFKHHQQLFYAILLPGFLGMVSMAGRRRTWRGLRLLALIAVLGLSTLWVACGGSSNSGGNTRPNTGTPTGTSTVTVSAASGSLQGSTKITLTVQ